MSCTGFGDQQDSLTGKTSSKTCEVFQIRRPTSRAHYNLSGNHLVQLWISIKPELQTATCPGAWRAPMAEAIHYPAKWTPPQGSDFPSRLHVQASEFLWDHMTKFSQMECEPSDVCGSVWDFKAAVLYLQLTVTDVTVTQLQLPT